MKAMTLILANAFDDGSGKKDAIRNRFEKAEEMMKEARSRYDGKKDLTSKGTASLLRAERSRHGGLHVLPIGL